VSAAEREGPRPAALVFALLAPAAAWAVHLGVSYSLTTPVCEAGTRWVLHAVWIASMALALGGGWVALHGWRHHRHETTRGRRFLLLAAMAWSVYLALAIFAGWLPIPFGSGCD
jgi:hypothetical protein